MHAVIDSERKTRNEKVGKQKQFQFANSESAFFKTRHEHLVGTATNLEHQMGKRLTTNEFARKLRKLNRDLNIRPHPAIEDKSVLYITIGDTDMYLMPLERYWMPEWSVMKTREERRPADPGNPAGYWKTVQVPGEEIKRGWRTVLGRLVRKRIIANDAMEREFGVGGRDSFYALTGKGYAKVEI